MNFKYLEEIFDKVIKTDLKEYLKYLEFIENDEKTLDQIKYNLGSLTSGFSKHLLINKNTT